MPSLNFMRGGHFVRLYACCFMCERGSVAQEIIPRPSLSNSKRSIDKKSAQQRQGRSTHGSSREAKAIPHTAAIARMAMNFFTALSMLVVVVIISSWFSLLVDDSVAKVWARVLSPQSCCLQNPAPGITRLRSFLSPRDNSRISHSPTPRGNWNELLVTLTLVVL